MPLCAVVDECLIPIGTSFLISKIGVVATAVHVIREALREDPTAQKAFKSDPNKKEHLIKYVQLSVLHHRQIDKTRTQVSAW